jgi:hypothetical protein
MSLTVRLSDAGDNNLKAQLDERAAANRQALATRNQEKETASKAATKTERRLTQLPQRQANKPGAAVPAVQADEQTALLLFNKLRVLNLVIGNGPVRTDDTGGSWYWTIVSDISEVRLIWTDTVFARDGTARPGPSDDRTFQNTAQVLQNAYNYAKRELNYIFGDTVTNVFLQVTGSQSVNPTVTAVPDIFVPSILVWDISDTVGEIDPNPNLLPADWGKVIPLNANNADIKGVLAQNGINVDFYDIVFVSYQFYRGVPRVDSVRGVPGGNSTYYYAQTPGVRWEYFRQNEFTNLITGKSNTAPVLNFMRQMDVQSTYFDVPFFNPTTAVNVVQYSNTRLFDVLKQLSRKSTGTLVVYRQSVLYDFLIGKGVFPTTERSVAYPVVGASFARERIRYNYKTADWSTQSDIVSRYSSYLSKAIERQPTSRVVGFENSPEYEARFNPYYLSTLNQTTVRR